MYAVRTKKIVFVQFVGLLLSKPTIPLFLRLAESKVLDPNGPEMSVCL